MNETFSNRQRTAGALLLVAACLISYANGLAGDFTYDDKAIVRDNARIRAPGSVSQLFTTPYFGGARGQGTGYRPLLLLSFALQFWIHGASAVAFHAANLALHCLVSLLFARFLLRLEIPGRVAFGAALLFAVHPIHVEAVTSLVGRGETLAAAFVFAFLLLALRFRAETRRRGTVFAGALAVFALAILTKESAAVAPALAFLAFWGLEVGTPGERVGRALRGGLPLYAGAAAILAGSFVLRRLVLGGVLKARSFVIFELENPLALLAAPERALNAAAILFRYVGRLVLPIRLSADESAWSIPVERGVGVFGAAAFLIALALVFAAIARERQNRDVAFGVLFFGIAFLPTANLLYPTGTVFAERLAYLPSAGFLLALASVILGPPAARPVSRLRMAVLFAIALAFGARTVTRNLVWKDDASLFEATVRSSPVSAKAHYNLAWLHAQAGRLPEALDHYTRATRIYPKYFDAWAGRGGVLQRMNDLAGAEKSFLRSLEAAPGYENGYFRLGVVRERRGDLAGAERAFADGAARNPKSAPLAYRLAIVRSRLGRESGEKDWRRAIAVSSGAAPFRLGYAQWLRSQGRTVEAAREAREVLRRHPRDVVALRSIADSRREEGQRFAEALAVEKIVRVTRSPEDFERLVEIAAADASYRKRFAEIAVRLNPRRPALRGRPGGGAGAAMSVPAFEPPARPRGDGAGG
ncbi:MAG: tetratricopeptide repeat protein, partial [Acidobacteriota bacterium]